MFKGRRVGTFTLGLVLIVFGGLLFLHTFIPTLSLTFIFSLWPLVLIILGLEVLISYIINKEDKLRYDGGAIALIIILSLFAVGAAYTQFFVEHYVDYKLFIH